MIRRGTYVLSITLGSDLDIEVGALGTFHFSKGLYCYVGSARGGIDQRVSRHIRREKTVKWHVDHLTIRADSVEAWISYPDSIPECELASMAVECGMVPSVRGFGCSDCRCDTHLFSADRDSLSSLVARAGLEPFVDARFPDRSDA